jgi:hypothetical protein
MSPVILGMVFSAVGLPVAWPGLLRTELPVTPGLVPRVIIPTSLVSFAGLCVQAVRIIKARIPIHLFIIERLILFLEFILYL